jgi:hypothetical protein
MRPLIGVAVRPDGLDEFGRPLGGHPANGTKPSVASRFEPAAEIVCVIPNSAAGLRPVPINTADLDNHGHRTAMPGDRHLAAGLDMIEHLGQMSTSLAHGERLQNSHAKNVHQRTKVSYELYTSLYFRAARAWSACMSMLTSLCSAATTLRSVPIANVQRFTGAPRR